MTVVDSSAVLAALLREPSAPAIARVIESGGSLLMAAPTLVEASIVAVGRLGPKGGQGVEGFIEQGDVHVVPFDGELADAAVEGWRRFGKGHHPAALNLGDCFTYALAKRQRDAVLCVGHDFAQTDVPVVPLA